LFQVMELMTEIIRSNDLSSLNNNDK